MEPYKYYAFRMRLRNLKSWLDMPNGWRFHPITMTPIFPPPKTHMGVSKNSGTPKSSILIGFSIIFTIHFGVPLFLETLTFWSQQIGG